jgi:hypothetical protein
VRRGTQDFDDDKDEEGDEDDDEDSIHAKLAKLRDGQVPPRSAPAQLALSPSLLGCYCLIEAVNPRCKRAGCSRES